MAGPDNTSTSERLARLAARGRATGTGAAAGMGSSPSAPSNPWAPIADAPPVAPLQSTNGAPWPQPSITTLVTGATTSAGPRSIAASLAGGKVGQRRKHHPARRSRIAAASVSASMLFGGIAVLAISDSYASTTPAADTSEADLGTSADPEATLAPEALQRDDAPLAPTTIGAAKVQLAPGTLPPTVPPTPTAAAAAGVAATATAATTNATADTAASAAADATGAADDTNAAPADATPAEPDPTAATVAPRAVQRPAATRAPRPRCSGSKC